MLKLGVAQRAANGRRSYSLCMIEELECRVLLSALPVAKPDFLLYRPVGAQRPAVASSPVGLTPSTILNAYGIDRTMFGSVTGDGSGQTIAIVDAYNAPNIVADLHEFDLEFGLADPPSLTRIGETGSTTLPGTDPSGPGDSWALETSLDVEWAHAVAPKAKILLVEAKSASDSDLFAAIDTARKYAGVSVVSMSWGGDEFSTQSTYDRYFTTPSGHNGVTFVASSGDSGAGVEYPASSPDVLSVGGTRLSTDSVGNYISESGWGDGYYSYYDGGSGGGISRYTRQPAFQSGVVTQSSTYRTVPDVSFDADPASGVAVYDSWDSSTAPWVQIGGTSLSAPLWAGVVAIADQGRAIAGLSSLDGATQTLPKLYSLPASDFHDITTGSNGYSAGVGYDLVTGRGSPIVNLLAPDLAGAVSVAQTPIPEIGGFVATPNSVTEGSAFTLTASGVQETSGSATIRTVVIYRESNGAGGLQTATDTFVGDAIQSGTTWTLATSAASLAPGNYTYYALATDSAGVTSTVASASLTVTPPAPANDNFASGTVLTGTSVSKSGTNVNATKEAGEPSLTRNAGGKSVWYTWTAPSSGRVTLTTSGSNFDTMLGVATGSTVSTATVIASNDDVSYHNLTSALTFNAVAGVTYHIAVDGYNGASGNVVINLSESVPPANDSFSGAALLTGSPVAWTGTNIGATRQAGEPYLAGNVGGASVWFAWTAPATRTYSLDTHGSNFDTMLGVYRGSSVSSLTLVGSNDDDPANNTLTSAVTFNAVAGTTYYFAVDGYNGAQGNIVLNLA